MWSGVLSQHICMIPEVFSHSANGVVFDPGPSTGSLPFRPKRDLHFCQGQGGAIERTALAT